MITGGGVGVGEGVGDGVGLGLTVGDGDGETVGDGLTVGDGDGDGLGVGVGAVGKRQLASPAPSEIKTIPAGQALANTSWGGWQIGFPEPSIPE